MAVAGDGLFSSESDDIIIAGTDGRGVDANGNVVDLHGRVLRRHADYPHLSSWVVNTLVGGGTRAGVVMASFNGNLLRMGGYSSNLSGVGADTPGGGGSSTAPIYAGGQRDVSINGGLTWLQFDNTVTDYDGSALAVGPQNSYGGVLVAHGGRLLRIGGVYVAGSEFARNAYAVWQSSDGGAWTRSRDGLPGVYAGLESLYLTHELRGMSAASLGGTLFVMFGNINGGTQIWATTETDFTRENVAWTDVSFGAFAAGSANAPGHDAKLVAFNGRLFIVGGSANNGRAVSYLQLGADGAPVDWHTDRNATASDHADSSDYAPANPTPVVYGNYLYLIGGYDEATTTFPTYRIERSPSGAPGTYHQIPAAPTAGAGNGSTTPTPGGAHPQAPNTIYPTSPHSHTTIVHPKQPSPKTPAAALLPRPRQKPRP